MLFSAKKGGGVNSLPFFYNGVSMKKILLLFTILLLLPASSFAMGLSRSGSVGPMPSASYAAWATRSIPIGGVPQAFIDAALRQIEGGGRTAASAGMAGISRSLLAKTAGVLPYVSLAMTAYLTYSDIRRACADKPADYPTLAAALNPDPAVIINQLEGTNSGQYYQRGAVILTLSGLPGVADSVNPFPFFSGSVNSICFVSQASQGGNHTNTYYAAIPVPPPSDPAQVAMEKLNGTASGYDAAVDPAYMADLDKLIEENLTGTNAEENWPDISIIKSEINAMKASITAKNDASFAAQVSSAASYSAAQSSASAATSARTASTGKSYGSAANPADATAAASAAAAARDALSAAQLASLKASIDAANKQAAFDAATSASNADVNNTAILDVLAADKIALALAQQSAKDAANNALLAQSTLTQQLAAQQLSIAAGTASAAKAQADAALVSAANTLAADPTNAALIAAYDLAALHAAATATAAATALNTASSSASTAAAATAAAQAQATDAAAQAAADQAAADDANTRAQPGKYDSSMVAPDKKSILSLLGTFLASSPMAAMVKSFTISADGVSSVSCGNVYGHEIVFDFVRYAPMFSTLGGLLLVIVHGYAVLVVVRGW